MGDVHADIDEDLASWIANQHVFFVATAPLSAAGRINCSPKGMDSLRVLGPRAVAYVDLTGSGAETIAHLRENSRMVLMFCAFDGAPRIVRLHGRGEPLFPGDPRYDSLRLQFPDYLGARAIIVASIERVSSSCGYSVPRYEFTERRDTLTRWADRKGPEGLAAYRREKNAVSIDGLPAITAPGALEST